MEFYKLICATDPEVTTAGLPLLLIMQIQDDQGAPVVHFEPISAISLAVVRDGSDEIAQREATIQLPGLLLARFTFSQSGIHRLYVSFQPRRGKLEVASSSLLVRASGATRVLDLCGHRPYRSLNRSPSSR